MAKMAKERTCRCCDAGSRVCHAYHGNCVGPASALKKEKEMLAREGNPGKGYGKETNRNKLLVAGSHIFSPGAPRCLLMVGS
jgi:hypothetical protein